MRGRDLIGVLFFLAIVLAGNYPVAPMAGVLVLVWARWSKTPWPSLGLIRPESWLRTVVGGVLFGAGLKIAMKALVMPLFGADPSNQAFHFLVGNQAALPSILYLAIVGAGFGEEMVFRGFLFDRFGRWLGSRAWATVVTVLVTSMWFAAEHYRVQGLAGVQQATVVGLVFGTIFAITRRLPMLMIAHAAFDVTAIAIIYWDLERTFAHLVFR